MLMDPILARIWRADGSVVDGGGAVSVSDRGFSLGDGVFETMLWTGEGLRFAQDHLARLSASARALGIPLPWATHWILEQVTGFVAANTVEAGQHVVRLTLSCGLGPRGLARAKLPEPVLVATIAPLAPWHGPVRLGRVSITRNPDSPMSRHKTLSYIDQILTLEEATAKGFDDALMLNTRGLVACASAANIIIAHKGALLTPPISDGALPGIVRGRLLRAGVLEEASIDLDLLSGCTGGALTNALISIRPIGAIDGRILDPQPGWIPTLLEVFA